VKKILVDDWSKNYSWPSSAVISYLKNHRNYLDLNDYFHIEGSQFYVIPDEIIAWCKWYLKQQKESCTTLAHPKKQPNPATTPTQNINYVKSTLNLSVVDLSLLFNVSRQSIAKWISAKAPMRRKNAMRIIDFCDIVDKLADAKISDASDLLNMKMFSGRSFIQLFANRDNTDQHIAKLISQYRSIKSKKSLDNE
jgi:DNA-binding transcriptional regulator YiaG